MVNAEFSRIYRFVKLLVNEGFLAVMLRHVALTAKTTHARPKVFSFNYSIIWQFCCTLDATFHTSQNSFKFGRQ